MSATLADAIAKVTYGGLPTDPADPHNQNDDFQQGYVVGAERDLKKDREGEGFDSIQWEYVARLCPEHGPELDSFKEWKRGYWAGVFRNV